MLVAVVGFLQEVRLLLVEVGTPKKLLHASRSSSWCGDRSRRTRLVHGFSVPPPDFPHAHGSSLSAPTSLVPQCRRVQDMWSAGMVFQH